MVKFLFADGSCQVLKVSREALNNLNKNTKGYTFAKYMQELAHDLKAKSWTEI